MASLWEFMIARQRFDALLMNDILIRERQSLLSLFGPAKHLPRKLLSLLQATLSASRDPGFVIIDPDPLTGNRQPDITAFLQWEMAALRVKFPDLRDPQAADELPFSIGPELLSADYQGLFITAPPQVAGQDVYLPCITNGFSAVRLVRVSLGGGPPKTVGELNIGQGLPWIQNTLLAGERFCIATEDRGLVVFPLRRGDPYCLNTAAGLPDNRVSAGLDAIGHELFFGVGGKFGAVDQSSSLVAYDLDTRALRVLATNTRREKKVPFESAARFEVTWMFADPPRHRLLFALDADELRPEALDRLQPSPMRGIWQYDTQAGTFSRQSKWEKLGNAYGRGRRVNDRFVILVHPGGVVLFDLETDRFRMLVADSPGFLADLAERDADTVTAKPPPPSPPPWSPPCLVGADLWFPQPFSRTSHVQQVIRPFPVLPDYQGGDRCTRLKWIQLLPDGRHLLVVNDTRATCLRLKEPVQTQLPGYTKDGGTPAR